MGVGEGEGEIVVAGSVTGSGVAIGALIDAALTHVRRSRTEPGCLSHDGLRAVAKPNRLFFHERWADREALDAHFAVPESRDFVRQLRDLAVDEPEMRITPTAD